MRNDERTYRQSIILDGGEYDTKSFYVPNGYTVSGTYSVKTNNPVKITVFYGLSIFGYPENVVASEQETSGDFSFKALGYAENDKYYIKVENPASAGFFGWGQGATITVTYYITVSGWTTWL